MKKKKKRQLLLNVLWLPSDSLNSHLPLDTVQTPGRWSRELQHFQCECPLHRSWSCRKRYDPEIHNQTNPVSGKSWPRFQFRASAKKEITQLELLPASETRTGCDPSCWGASSSGRSSTLYLWRAMKEEFGARYWTFHLSEEYLEWWCKSVCYITTTGTTHTHQTGDNDQQSVLKSRDRRRGREAWPLMLGSFTGCYLLYQCGYFFPLSHNQMTAKLLANFLLPHDCCHGYISAHMLLFIIMFSYSVFFIYSFCSTTANHNITFNQEYLDLWSNYQPKWKAVLKI